MAKNIVICCDGTSNDVTGDSTNVLRLYRSLERSERQLCRYDPGVGTVPDPTQKTLFGKWLSRKLDMGVGYSVRANVCAGYRFLCQHFEANDRIFLFGFSRGAYAMRALAGMIHFLGLLRPELDGLENHAWAIYSDDYGRFSRSERFAAAARFKKCFSLSDPPSVHLIGVWDTVSSFGWIWNLRTVPYTADNPSVLHVRHAVSIDERRSMFQPNLFRPAKATHHSFKQEWFAGTHGDVGGGWPPSKNGLARIALAWMVRECRDLGLYLDNEQLNRTLAVDIENAGDDELVSTPVNPTLRGPWWLLEFLPRRQWDTSASPERMRWFMPHFGKARKLPQNAAVNNSVLRKLECDPNYQPRNLSSHPTG